MAVGDAITTFSSIANDAYLTIQPAGSIEWIVHNIYANAADAIILSIYDGSNEEALISTTGSIFNMNFHLTNSVYMRVQNKSGDAAYIGFDGVVSK